MITASPVHLIGIGGIGMSGLARLLVWAGRTVTGSDAARSEITDALMQEGVEITIGHDAKNIPTNTQLVVHTLALTGENVELVAAHEREIRVLSYPAAVAELAKEKRLVAVAGTHGKTTTTSMIIAGALTAGEEISALVGSKIPELPEGGNARAAAGDWFVLEACEYRRAFLAYHPELLVITSLEADHLDYYTDETDYISAFAALVQQMPPHGIVIGNSTEPHMAALMAVAPNFFDTKDLVGEMQGIKLTGEHNRRNAALAMRACELMGCDVVASKQGIEQYAGAWRRLEYKGKLHGAAVYDDYAHHPTEVRATLQALRELHPDKKIIAVYQQHQVGRVRMFLDRLAISFDGAEQVIIPNIYVVRESADDAEEMAEKLAHAITAAGVPAVYTGGTVAAELWLRENVDESCVVLVMGAGDITELAGRIVL